MSWAIPPNRADLSHDNAVISISKRFVYLHGKLVHGLSTV